MNKKRRRRKNQQKNKTILSIGVYGINSLINYIVFPNKRYQCIRNSKQHWQHLKLNNIISKLAFIVLSIVLLTGVSLFPTLQIGVNGQVQQQ